MAINKLDNRTVVKQRSLLQKADLAVSDLTGSGGILLATQAKKFMRLVIDESKFLQDVAFVPMTANTYRIDKIKFGSRVLRRGSAGTPLLEGDRVKPDLSRTEITTQEFKGEVNLNDHVMEDNIEGEMLQETILQILAEAVARDIEEVAVNGDTASADDFLKAFNGFIKLASSNVFDAQDASTTKTIWKEMVRTLPTRYIRSKDRLVIYTSMDSELDYQDSLANRQTMLGDSKVVEASESRYSGIPVRSIPLWPENVGTGSHCTRPLMMDPKNANVGMQRRIRIETDRDIRAGVVILVITTRFGVQYADEQGVVKGDNVKVIA